MKKQSLPVILLMLVLSAAVEAKFYSADIARERLVTDLLVNYNPSSRPLPKGETVNIDVHIELQHFDFRESDGSFHLVGLLDASWHDPKLTWNPNDYNNLTRIPLSPKVIWIPDLEVYNNSPDKFLRTHRNGIVVLDKTGTAFWSDTIDITLFCSTNFLNWPHDRHDCKMSLGSWTYDGFEVNITNIDTNTTMNFDSIDMKAMEYRIISFAAMHVSTLYQCCTEPYITIDYHLSFERRSAFVMIFRVPALCVILLTLLALAMEPSRSEKLWLNGVSIILIVFNLIHFANYAGRFARKTPYIVIYFSFSLVLVTLAQLIAIFSLLATRSRFNGKLPLLVSRFLKCSVVNFFAPTQVSYAKHDHAELNSQFEDVKLQEFSNLISADSYPNEWTVLAKIVERFALVLFGLIFLILGTICFV